MVQDNTIIHSYKWGYQGIKSLNDFPKFIQLVSANPGLNLGSLAAEPVFLILDHPHFALQILFLIQDFHQIPHLGSPFKSPSQASTVFP